MGLRVQDLVLDGPAMFKGAVLADKPREAFEWDKVRKTATDKHEGYSFEVALPALRLEKARVKVLVQSINVDAFDLMRPIEFEGLEVVCYQDWDSPKDFSLSATATGVKSSKPSA